jgi:hypothetical protein
MSSHFTNASGSEIKAFRKSTGSPCTTPSEIILLTIELFYIKDFHLPKKSNVRLPSSDDIIKALSRIVEVFSNPTEIEVVKTRWEEIKKLESVSTSIVAIAP